MPFYLILQWLENAISDALKEWLKLNPDLSVKFSAKMLRDLLRMLDEPLKLVKTAGEVLGQQLVEADYEAKTLSEEHTQDTWILLLFLFEDSFEKPNVLKSTHKKRKYSQRVKKFKADAKRSIKRQLTVSMILEDTIGSMLERLRKLYPAKAREKLQDPEAAARGLVKTPRHIGTRIIRTEPMITYNEEQARNIATLENVDMLMWESTMDMRTCPICTDLDGKTALEGESFALGIVLPPAHPFCRCSVIPWKKAWGKL